MKTVLRIAALLAVLGACHALAGVDPPPPAGFKEAIAPANGTKIHYQVGGSGSAVVLLHGYAQTSYMWRPVMGELAKRHTVIVPDLRGAGDSEKAESGYDKKNMARDIHELVKSLGVSKVTLVGHDIGLMVAYAYAAQWPAEVDRIVLMDAFLPGIGNTEGIFLLRDKWHFHFYGETPLKLVAGRERIYLEHFWNDFAADPKHSVSERDRRIYTRAYAQKGGMRSTMEYFANFEKDAEDFKAFSKVKLEQPMLVLTGEKASGQFLIDQAKRVDANVEGVIVKGSGHWLMDEATAEVVPLLVKFID